MFLIGLTGGIASGKSTVAKLLAAHGAETIDADQVAREVVEVGSTGLSSVSKSLELGFYLTRASSIARSSGRLFLLIPIGD